LTTGAYQCIIATFYQEVCHTTRLDFKEKGTAIGGAWEGGTMGPDVYDLEFSDTALTTYILLRQAWLAVNRVVEARLAKMGLTPENFLVLWTCRDYPSPLIPAEIARIAHRENQTIAGLLNRMEREGLVLRVPKRKGHPFTEVKITAKGEKLLDTALPVFKSIVSDLISDMPTQKQKECQVWHRELRDKALDKLHLVAGPPSEGVTGKPIDLKW
jgi:DNA-binding MarR family transcriptional regulator